MATSAIQTTDLVRTYRARCPRGAGRPAGPQELTALAGVSLEVQQGELFGLLGPNGAGKTTLIKILTTLLTPTQGTARVDGLDVVTQADTVRRRINMVSGGESSGYGLLTIRENLWLFTQLYGVPRRVALQRIDEMLHIVGLTDRADTKISQLSTGLRQKMNFCRGFVTDPKILFLDEPTLGLDVTAARNIRAFVRRWLGERPSPPPLSPRGDSGGGEGRTLLLTTHYMMEADELCDRVAIIDKGRVLACDPPAVLKRRVQKHSLFEIDLAPNGADWAGLEQLPGVAHLTAAPGPEATVLKAALHEESAVGAVVQAVVAGGGRILTMRKVEPTLEDVFIQLVGHGLNTEGA